jgi:hypothetical protein
MNLMPAYVALLAYTLSSARILFYRRGDATHKRHISWLAWMLLAVCGGSAIDTALHMHAVTILDACRAWALLIIVASARGNVARMLGCLE